MELKKYLGPVILQFIFQDDLYEVKFLPKAHEIPTVISLFLGIATALDLVLNQVREDSEPGFDHLLYPCISDNRIKVQKDIYAMI